MLYSNAVVGFDPIEKYRVQADDLPIEAMRAKCHGSEGSLVCFACQRGYDRHKPQDVHLEFCAGVPGKIRPYFRHPKGLAPRSDHEPRTKWHSDAIEAAAAWVKRQPSVIGLVTEKWMPSCLRVPDIAVTLSYGKILIIEIQQCYLSDSAWLERHRSYQAAGILDVWIWHKSTRIASSARQMTQRNWVISEDIQEIGIPIAIGHFALGDSVGRDVSLSHYPACPGDKVIVDWEPLAQFGLSDDGLVPPIELTHAAASSMRRLSSRPKNPRGAFVDAAAPIARTRRTARLAA